MFGFRIEMLDFVLHTFGFVLKMLNFAEPIRDDPSRNLKILTNTHVHKIIFEGTKAVGVIGSDGPNVLRISIEMAAFSMENGSKTAAIPYQ